ncbi:hypothetical protein O3G_MSEX000830 [Manduca sexta]|nr:hypothetical protein O3G_MSEX000830 [Manduca sexta]
MKTFVLLLVSVAVVTCKPAGGDEDVISSVMGVVKSCSEDNISLCLKEKALRYVENIASARELNLVDGITLVGSGSPRSGRSFEPLAEEPRARESQVETRLVDAAADFFENHVIQFRMPKSTVEDVKRSLEEGEYF